MIEDQEQAKARAQNKFNYYVEHEPSLSHIEGITNYINTSLTHLSSDIVRVGVTTFFSKKQTKWERRISAPADCFAEAYEFYDTMAESTNSQAFDYACKTSEEILFLQQAINILKETGAHAKSQSTDKPALFITDVENLIKALKISKKERGILQRLHTTLNEEIFNLIGIDSQLLSLPLQGRSIVCVSEGTFKKCLDGKEDEWDVPYGIDQLSSSKWKEGDPLSKAFPHSHGDRIVKLIQTFPFNSQIRRVVSSLEEYYSYLYDGTNKLNQNVSTPIVFNCSWTPNTPCYYIQKKGKNLQWADDPRDVEDLNYLKASLKSNFPDDDCNGPLKAQHVNFLQQVEKENRFTPQEPLYARELVLGPKGDQPHLLIASAYNAPGSLVKNPGEFHGGRIRLLDNLPEDRILVALNWNPITGDLDPESHSAGEYNDRAVTVPAAYMSIIMDETDPVPYFYLGGHSSATGILSATVSWLERLFPEAPPESIIDVILLGANKDFPGYTKKLHGEGMLNFKGAVETMNFIISDLSH